MKVIYSKLAVILIAWACWPTKSWACATCFGAEGDPQTEGLNMAIITLLGVTYSLFTGMAAFAFYRWKKNSTLLENQESDAVYFQEAPTTHG